MRYIYTSKIGNILITADEKFILTVSFTDEAVNFLEKNDVINLAVSQLDEYFKGVRKTFNLPLNPNGTEFQKRVWKELIKIPYGEIKNYKEIAKAIGNENSSRAVGNANNKNPIAIIIPCHRVIGTNKKLTGYAYGLDKKKKLLELEKVTN